MATPMNLWQQDGKEKLREALLSTKNTTVSPLQTISLGGTIGKLPKAVETKLRADGIHAVYRNVPSM